MEVAEGKFSASGKKVGIKTVKNYVREAAQFAINISKKDPCYRCDEYGNKLGGENDYIPGLKLFYNQMTKWEKKKSKALPLTPEIIADLIKTASRAPLHSVLPCTRDGIILGSYTGSRCSEYCRGKRKKNDPFELVPSNPHTVPFDGWPIAFTAVDFSFLSKDKILIPHSLGHSAAFVQIRFRFDKGGGGNFNVRTFARVSNKDTTLAFCCPVATSCRIISRWSSISNKSKSPVFCYLKNPKSSRTIAFLDDQVVNSIIRACVTRVYPNPGHLFRINIKDFRTHSIRVYACLVLNAAGFKPHAIEYQLRWASAAWKVYIRENLAKIPQQTADIFREAFVSSDAQPLVISSIFDDITDDGN